MSVVLAAELGNPFNRDAESMPFLVTSSDPELSG